MLVGHLSSGPHFFDQKVPEFSLCFQVGLKRLGPAGSADTKEGNTDQQKGSGGYFHSLHRNGRGLEANRAPSWIESRRRGPTPDLYVSELCDFKEARLSLSDHEQTFLSHGNFTNTAGGLDAGRQLVDALVIVETIYDLRGQVDMSCLSFCLLPEGVEHPERFRIYLFGLGWDEQRERS